VERETLVEKGFSTVGTKLIHVPGTGTHVLGTWNMAPYHVPGDYGCGPGHPHFDMSQPAWEHIGVVQGGIIPVLYQQVKCSRTGGVRWALRPGA
jgi:expansin (peptidoglycan-binding protein)